MLSSTLDSSAFLFEDYSGTTNTFLSIKSTDFSIFYTYSRILLNLSGIVFLVELATLILGEFIFLSLKGLVSLRKK